MSSVSDFDFRTFRLTIFAKNFGPKFVKPPPIAKNTPHSNPPPPPSIVKTSPLKKEEKIFLPMFKGGGGVGGTTNSAVQKYLRNSQFEICVIYGEDAGTNSQSACSQPQTWKLIDRIANPLWYRFKNYLDKFANAAQNNFSNRHTEILERHSFVPMMKFVWLRFLLRYLHRGGYCLPEHVHRINVNATINWLILFLIYAWKNTQKPLCQKGTAEPQNMSCCFLHIYACD